MVLRLRGVSLLLGCLYMGHSLGLTGPNVAKLGQLDALIAALRLPFLLIGDFNMAPRISGRRGGASARELR